jgi:hypothetical protein
MFKKLKITQRAYCNMEKNAENVFHKRLMQFVDLLIEELITLLGINTSLVEQTYSQTRGIFAIQMLNHYTT